MRFKLDVPPSTPTRLTGLPVDSTIVIVWAADRGNVPRDDVALTVHSSANAQANSDACCNRAFLDRTVADRSSDLVAVKHNLCFPTRARPALFSSHDSWPPFLKKNIRIQTVAPRVRLELFRETDRLLQLQEFSLRKPTVASSTSAARLSRIAGNVSFFLTFSISFSVTFGYNVLSTVPTCLLHVAEIEIEKVRKKDTCTSLHCKTATLRITDNYS
jgi:hypothetical protein